MKQAAKALQIKWIAVFRKVLYPEAMEVHFTPEQEAHLLQLADAAGVDTERLVKEAALRLLEGGSHLPSAASVVAEMRHCVRALNPTRKVGRRAIMYSTDADKCPWRSMPLFPSHGL